MIDDYETFVFDLDGTLVRLEVDWDAVVDDVAATLREHGVDPPGSLWGMLEAADNNGHRSVIEEVISAYERDGAAVSTRLPAANTVPAAPVGVGVCSLNSESACRIALSEHGLDRIEAVVGRDTVPTEKPDPLPLLETIDRLDGDPSGTLFIGDTDRDATTAEHAGVDYADVSRWLRAYR
jgi:phosphoglycolate phosphatase-like HAD superfamily hydrolase